MGDFLIHELNHAEGMWTVVDENLVFINSEETQYHLPKELTIMHYEVHNYSKDITFWHTERKQFQSMKSAMKDATKKLRNKPDGYQYAIYLQYKHEGGKSCMSVAAILRKENEWVSIRVPNLTNTYKNGSLSEEEKKQVERTTLPPSWISSRRVNRPIVLLEKELKDVYNVKEILYTANHPHKEKEQFLRTLEHYFSVLSKKVDCALFPFLTIRHNLNKSFSGNYADWNKEMTLQPKKYTSFFHLYWFHMYYTALSVHTLNHFNAPFNALVKKIFEEETMINHDKKYQSILNKRGEVLAKYKHKPSGRYHLQFTSAHQMIARLFSDYFFYYYESSFEEREKKQSFNFTTREIELFAPHLEELIQEIHKTTKKKSS